jgi:hypothetical protein
VKNYFDEHLIQLVGLKLSLEPGLPTGRFFGRKTQKGPNKNISGRTNLRPNFGRIFPKRAKKGPKS